MADRQTPSARAEAFIRAELPPNGRTVASAKIRAAAEAAGLSWRTCQRVAGQIGVQITNVVEPNGRSTYWAFKADPVAPSPVATPPIPDAESPTVTRRRGSLGIKAAALLRGTNNREDQQNG